MQPRTPAILGAACCPRVTGNGYDKLDLTFCVVIFSKSKFIVPASINVTEQSTDACEI